MHASPVRRYASGADFMSACSEFLCEREAENNLLLGIGGTLGAPDSPYAAFYLASAGSLAVEGAFMLTPPRYLQLSSPVSESAMDAVIQDLLAVGHRQLPGVNGVAHIAGKFAELWCAETGARTKSVEEGYCYALSQVRPTSRAAGAYRAAVKSDLELLVAWSHAFDADANLGARDDDYVRKVLQKDIESGHYFIWEDGSPVAMARSSGATPSGIRVSAVYTPAGLRGRGYATSLVAAISSLALERGRKLCFLFTDATNPTSNKIYQRIGYEKVCDFHQHSFGSAE